MSRLTLRQILIAIAVGAIFAALQGESPVPAPARMSVPLCAAVRASPERLVAELRALFGAPLDAQTLAADAQLVARLQLPLLEPEEDAVGAARVQHRQLLPLEFEDGVQGGDERILVEPHVAVA